MMQGSRPLGILVLALALTGAAIGQEPPPAQPVPAPKLTPEEEAAVEAAAFREEVARVVDKVQMQRGGKVPAGFVAQRATSAERDSAVEAALAARIPPDRLAARGVAWADIGLGDRDAPARLWRRLAVDVDSLALDASGTRLLISDEILTDRDFLAPPGEDTNSAVLLATGIRPDEPLVAHMVAHALQRSRAKAAQAQVETTDAALARHAWEEGEANLIAIGLLFQGLRLADAILQPGIDPGRILDGRLVYPGIEALPHPDATLLDFVYQEGYAQAVRAFRSGGFRSLEQAAAARTTTRALLHPERSVPPIQERVPLAAPAPGLVLADTDSLGEQGIFALVSGRTGKDDLALAAGDGWRFDRLARWDASSKDPDAGVTLWETDWASDEDAAEFAYAVGRVLEDGLGATALPGAAGGRKGWSGPNRVYRLAQTGRTLTLRVATAEVDAALEPPAQPASRGKKRQ
jgi:hypothetical protein